jgi:hypothetical protein
MLDDDRERFLDFDGWRFWLANGWSVRFRVKVAKITKERPAGIKYSLTMHDSNGNRVLGYDNAERKRKRIKWIQRRTAYDHYHPFRRIEDHVPYYFVDFDQLQIDFLNMAMNSCKRESIAFTFVAAERVNDYTEIDD